MKLYNKALKNKDNKGFTLVELVVVLVIIGLLSAFLIPNLLGYIDDTRQKQAILSARSALTASQAEFSSLYSSAYFSRNTVLSKDICEDILNLADLDDCTYLYVGTKQNANDRHAAYTVSYLAYGCSDGAVYYDGSAWVDTDPFSNPSLPITVGAPSNNATGGVIYSIYKIK